MIKKITLTSLLLLLTLGMKAQVITHVDTLECSIVGFNVGVKTPSNRCSFASLDGEHSKEGIMHDLYKPPYMEFGMSYMYKFISNWLLFVDANFMFGNNNLTQRQERLGLYTNDDISIIIGTNGTDANVTCYNRGLSLQGGIGRIFNVNEKNPNSGILAKIGGGWMQNQTIFFKNDVEAPQIDGDYSRLYDQQRRGFMLTESIGYIFMSNHENLMNFSVSFEVSQCWSHSTRDFVIDNVMGLCGPDNNRYFDMLYTIKLCWMFPLTGRPAYDYYFY